MKQYKVAIIGAGTSGLSARREVAKLTDSYVVIDDGILGTTCARVGCMPSKVLIQAANDFHRRDSLAEQGILGGKGLTVDSKLVMQHVRKLRDRFVRGVTNDMNEWTEKHLIRKRAVFVDAHTLDLGDEKIQAESIIIATGSKPVIPSEWSTYKKYLIDTDMFFEMESLPKSVALVGLGVIGLELGQALARLGVDVHAFTSTKKLGGLSDPDLQDYAYKFFEKEFAVSLGRVESVTEEGNKVLVKAKAGSFKADALFMAMGRRPVLKDLKLERAGIKLDEKGMPEFSTTSFNIPGTTIYIAGDVNGQRAILHEASDEGRIAGYNAVRASKECFSRRVPLAITFCEPNIAVIGRSFADLTKSKKTFVTGKVSFEGQGRSIVKLMEAGLMHIYAEPESGNLLGAELFAPDGEHMAHLLSWAIGAGWTAAKTLSMPFYHPVVEEGMRTALRAVQKQVNKDQNQIELFRCTDPPAGTLA